MDQVLALEIMGQGESVLLTGPAGSGKTYVLDKFIKRARSEGKVVAVTATTGLAATHLNGSTIHSWSGIGIHDFLPGDFDEFLPKGRRETIENTDVLVIDEISMLHDYRLDMVDEVARKVRKNDAPFGGLQVVLCGDFFQLPPVSRSGQAAAQFVLHSRVWKELAPHVCYLLEQHRQDDDSLSEILNALREGELTRDHVEVLLARQGAVVSHGEATELHTINVNVDSINSQKLELLDGEEYEYEMSTSGSKNYVETLKKSCLAVERLVLKKGAFVMCIKNNSEKRYANGSLGTVVDFDDDTDYPVIELKTGRRITIEPESWELRDGDKKRASLSQIPLRLAWAITVHKSQGMTLDAARVDLRRAFVEGMGYVALSRVRRLDTLSLVGINQMALRVNPETLENDSMLRAASQTASQKFVHLRELASKRSKEEVKRAASKPNSWNEKLEKMRQKYPNAYKPWGEVDDAKLVKFFSEGKAVDINKLTAMFGRHPGSIKARLKKHFGEDAIE